MDMTYKNMGIKAEECKPKNRKLIVFNEQKHCDIFADWIGGETVPVVDGFLVVVLGAFASTDVWGDMLLNCKKRTNLEYKTI